MKDQTVLCRDLSEMVSELRGALKEISENDLPQTRLVSDTRDRLRYIASLTEQAASQTMNAVETVGDRLRTQSEAAQTLTAHTRSPRVRAFLQALQTEHAESAAQLTEVVQAQAFQDLVGQVVNKLLTTVQRLEDSLAHLIVEAEPEAALDGPQIQQGNRISQDEVDDLFG